MLYDTSFVAMKVILKVISVIILLQTLYINITRAQDVIQENKESPAVLISILIRNKAHVLPYFFSFLENLNYPKNRIGLFIRSDHNIDNSVQIIDAWLNSTQNNYHTVNKKYKLGNGKRRTEKSETDWPYERLTHVINLKEEALNFARKNWYDFVMFLDADVLLSNTNVLQNLIALDLPVVTPMISTAERTYTNFWTTLESDFTKTRTDDFNLIQSYTKKGHFKVEFVSNVVLINLNVLNSDGLTFDKKILNTIGNKKSFYYEGPLDGDTIFSVSAKQSNCPIYVTNDQIYGFVLQPLLSGEDLSIENESLVDALLQILDESASNLIDVKTCFKNFMSYPKPDTLGLDRIFVLNYEKDIVRRNRFEQLSRIMGLNVQRITAFEGKNLTIKYIEDNKLSQLSGYENPVEKRPMTLNQIGWLLSHYEIWKLMIKKSLEFVLIVEDNVKFGAGFKTNALRTIEEAKATNKEWDLIYFSRKWMGGEEPRIEGSKILYETAYSPSTTAYVLTLQGAKKLINAKPLSKMVPIEELLPIMSNKHPNKDWSKAYSNRNLVAWHVYPPLVDVIRS